MIKKRPQNPNYSPLRIHSFFLSIASLAFLPSLTNPKFIRFAQIFLPSNKKRFTTNFAGRVKRQRLLTQLFTQIWGIKKRQTILCDFRQFGASVTQPEANICNILCDIMFCGALGNVDCGEVGLMGSFLGNLLEIWYNYWIVQGLKENHFK